MLLLRLALVVILIMHSIPGMFDGGVTAFGELYLNKVGFAPLGVTAAWLIKGSHVVSAILFFFNKCIKTTCLINIIFFLMGIVMIHLENGWFVVGGGYNGFEYNFLIICVLLSILNFELKKTRDENDKHSQF